MDAHLGREGSQRRRRGVARWWCTTSSSRSHGSRIHGQRRETRQRFQDTYVRAACHQEVQPAGGRGSNRSAGRRPATTTVVIGASWRAHGTAAGAALTDGDGHECTSGAPRALRRRRRRRRCWSHAGRSARERDTVTTHAVQSVR